MPHAAQHGATIDPISVDDNLYKYPNDLHWIKYSNVTSESLVGDDRALNYAEGSPVDRVIVAGSRSIDRQDLVHQVLLDAPDHWFNWTPLEIVHGGAVGVDSLANEVCREILSEPDIITVFDARFNKFGPRAGPERNREMAQYADKLIAIWDGQSTGTRSMIEHGLEQGLDVHVVNVGHRDL